MAVIVSNIDKKKLKSNLFQSLREKESDTWELINNQDYIALISDKQHGRYYFEILNNSSDQLIFLFRSILMSDENTELFDLNVYQEYCRKLKETLIYTLMVKDEDIEIDSVPLNKDQVGSLLGF